MRSTGNATLRTIMPHTGMLRMLARKLAAGVLPALLIGCAVVPIAPGPAFADEHSNPLTAEAELRVDRGQLMYELMIAELAGRRGNLDVATEGYLRAAKKTNDIRVAERATKLAVWGQQWEQAEAAVRRWLQIDATVTEARELLAQILLRRGDINGAASAFARVVEQSDEPDDALQQVYALVSREGNARSALETLQGLQARFPKQVQSHLGVARMLLRMNAREQALAAVNSALAVDPGNGEALLTRAQVMAALGQAADGFDELKAALERDADNISLRMGYARLLVNSGRYAEASIELETLFEIATDDPDVLLTIGLLALDAKRTEAGQRYLEALLDTTEHRDQAHFYLARIEDERQQYDKAIGLYEKVGEGELFLSAQLRSAELYALSGELEIGIERVRSLKSMLPDPAMQPMLLMTESRMLQNADKNGEAVSVLSDALVKFPDSGELLYARALAAERAGDRQTMIDDLQVLIEREPGNANALNALGYSYADANMRLDEAEQLLEKAITLKPDDAAILDSIGWLRYRQGNSAAALALLKRAYELFPDAEIAAHLGEVLWVSGDQQAALTLWDKALLDSPDDKKIIEALERLSQ